jgi:hypothetical protein
LEKSDFIPLRKKRKWYWSAVGKMTMECLNSIRDTILFPNPLSDRDRTVTHRFIADSLLDCSRQTLG